VLSLAPAYRLTQAAVGADRFRRIISAEYLRATSTDRILDIGCGTGDIVEHMTFADYVGLDPNPRYIAAAKERDAPHTTFVCSGVEQAPEVASSRTLVIAIGVLHHLDDEAASALIELACRSLAPRGRFVAVDPGLVEGQPWFARQLIVRDRGANVRTPESTRELVTPVFPRTRVHIRDDLLRVPYTHLVVESSV
jgi:SAM-dependent methyltransferase